MTDGARGTYRIVCPGSEVCEVFVNADVVVARAYAAHFDRVHDDAVCSEPHRVERATWEPIERTTN